MLALIVALAVPAFASAQAQPPAPASEFIGKPVTEVRILSEGRAADEPALRDLIETRVGQPLSMASVRESITHLFSLRRFQDIQVEATATPGGVSLHYNLVPVHDVFRVDFRGNIGVSEGAVRQMMVDRFGATPPVGRAGDVATALEQQFYPDHGYMHARVKPVPTVTHDPDRTLLTFDIDAGPRAVIRNVTIIGDLAVGRAEFQRQVGAATGDNYEAVKIKNGLSDYVQKLKKRSLYEATATFVPTVSDDGTAIDIRFDVQPGSVITVVLRGDTLPADKIKDLVPVEREGSIDQDLLEDSARRITDFLNEQGYWKATAEPAREQGTGTATVVFTVRKGLQYYVAPGGVDVTGNQQIPIEQLRTRLERLKPNDIYVSANLTAAVAGIANDYATRGFASVKVNAGQNELNPVGGTGQVKPVIAIQEGPLTRVGDITFHGNEHLASEELRNVVRQLAAGDPYYEPKVQANREAVVLTYLNMGFPGATVVVRPIVSKDGTRADLDFQVTEGPQSLVDHIIIVGNTHTDPRIIQRELLLKPESPLGLEDRLESRRRLGALGLFKRVTIDELPPSANGRHDVLVSVEEAATTTLSYGGGVEAAKRFRATGPSGTAEEHLEFAPRGFFDIGRRNIAGKNRSVNLYTRVSLRPRDAPSDPTKDGTGLGFSEYRVVGTYHEPRALGMKAADLTVTGASEQGVRTSFNFWRQGVNAEVTRPVASRMRASVRYSFSTTKTFDERLSDQEQVTIDRAVPRVRLSSFAGALSYDTRDDVLEPSRGGFLSAEATLAARALGGQVGFLKTYMQGYWFVSLPTSKRVVFASRAAVGLANGFPREVTTTGADGNVSTEVVEDLPASERFFVGGGSTIRGFAADTVGAPNTISAKGFPIGGNAVLILNAELRLPVPVFKDVGAVLFVDGGNVFNRVTEIDLGALRGGYGLGLRYRSPIGPIRIDLGFKMDRRVIGGVLESPHVTHFGIGYSF